MQSVKEQLDTGTLGEPGLLRIHSWESADPADPIQQTPCVREIDLACWLFRQSPTQVYAVASSSEVLPETNDYTQVHLGFANGGMSLIDKCRSLPAGDSYFSLSMIGSTGAAYADDHRNMQLSFRGGRPSAVNTGQEIAEAVLELQEFIDAIEQDREPSITIADVKTTAQVTMAITESLESKQPVSLEPGP
jgi:predicted dehydrogenase